jgi:hypothetical protein
MNGMCCVLVDAKPRSCSEQARARRAVSWRVGASHVSQRSMSRNTEGVTRIARQVRRCLTLVRPKPIVEVLSAL